MARPDQVILELAHAHQHSATSWYLLWSGWGSDVAGAIFGGAVMVRLLPWPHGQRHHEPPTAVWVDHVATRPLTTDERSQLAEARANMAEVAASRTLDGDAPWTDNDLPDDTRALVAREATTPPAGGWSRVTPEIHKAEARIEAARFLGSWWRRG
jgi:hypothetical protein